MSTPSGSTPVSTNTPAPESTPGDVATQQAQTQTSPTQEVAEQAEGEQLVDKAKAGEELTKQEKQELKKWLLKSGGKSREVTDEQELVRLAQMGLGAHEKFEKAAAARKESEALLELLKTNPAKALESLGHDVKKLAEEYIWEEAQKELMSPEELEKAKIKKELDDLRAERDREMNEKRERQVAQLQAQYEETIQEQIIEAIDKYKLPKNPKTVARIADYMTQLLEADYEDVSPLDVAHRVRKDLEDEHKALYNNYDVEELIKLLGDDKIKKIRQYEVDKVKAKASPSPTKTEAVKTPPKEGEEEKPSKKMTMTEFQEELDKLTR